LSIAGLNQVGAHLLHMAWPEEVVGISFWLKFVKQELQLEADGVCSTQAAWTGCGM